MWHKTCVLPLAMRWAFVLWGCCCLLSACASDLKTIPVDNPEPALVPATLPLPPLLLQRPIIVGAGLSTGLSPARRLALKFTRPENIYTVALPSQPATYLLPRVPDERILDRTVFIGLDLFFWDAQSSECAPVANEITRLFDRTNLIKLPLILGDVPDVRLLRPLPCRDTINRLLRRRCSSRPDCRIVPLDALYETLIKRGQLRIQGKLYDQHALLPDGLHPSELATGFLEDILAKTMLLP